MKRSQFLEELANHIARIELPHPLRVAIDGVDAAGKTTLADELEPLVRATGRPVIRASVDGFHNPSAIRYRRGRTSAEGYYRDSFNYRALIDMLLKPLGPNGSLRYHPAAFDYRTDAAIDAPDAIAEPQAVLLFDGIFILRPEFREYWDLTIFVEAAFDVTLSRAMQRHLELYGNTTDVERLYEQRYIPGQKIYFEECRPKENADVIVDNNDLHKPVVFYRS